MSWIEELLAGSWNFRLTCSILRPRCWLVIRASTAGPLLVPLQRLRAHVKLCPSRILQKPQPDDFTTCAYFHPTCILSLSLEMLALVLPGNKQDAAEIGCSFSSDDNVLLDASGFARRLCWSSQRCVSPSLQDVTWLLDLVEMPQGLAAIATCLL